MKCRLKHLLSIMSNLRNIIVLLVIIFSSVVTSNVYSMDSANSPPQSSSSAIKPDPKYSPEEVVRFQIEALAQNDVPYKNAGIEFAFSFASPPNKKATGPLERFIRLVNNPVYQPMLNHQASQYGELRVNGDQAIQIVILTTSDGKRVSYIFTLSRQQGDSYDKCWMTDSVLLYKLNEV